MRLKRIIIQRREGSWPFPVSCSQSESPNLQSFSAPRPTVFWLRLTALALLTFRKVLFAVTLFERMGRPDSCAHNQGSIPRTAALISLVGTGAPRQVAGTVGASADVCVEAWTYGLDIVTIAPGPTPSSFPAFMQRQVGSET